LFDGAGGRPGHIADLQILRDNHRVVFADGGRSLVQEVPSCVGDANMDALDFGFCLLPAVGELLLAAHSLLRFAQIGRAADQTDRKKQVLSADC